METLWLSSNCRKTKPKVCKKVNKEVKFHGFSFVLCSRAFFTATWQNEWECLSEAPSATCNSFLAFIANHSANFMQDNESHHIAKQEKLFINFILKKVFITCCLLISTVDKKDFMSNLNVSAAGNLREVLVQFKGFVYFVVSHAVTAQASLSGIIHLSKYHKFGHVWNWHQLTVQQVGEGHGLRRSRTVCQPEPAATQEDRRMYKRHWKHRVTRDIVNLLMSIIIHLSLFYGLQRTWEENSPRFNCDIDGIVYLHTLTMLKQIKYYLMN